MAKYMKFTFPASGASARARLLEKEAPETSRILWRRLPIEIDAFHAMYSGTCCAIFLDPAILITTENATNLIQRGDLMFTHYDPGTRHGHPEGISEIYWAYDRYCSPRAPGHMGPVYPNIFGEFLPGSEAFFATSRAIAREGPKRLTVTGEAD